jgi:poly-gamma-glutamate system protein
MKRSYFGPRGVSRAAMLLIAVIALGALIAVEKLKVMREQPWYAQKLAAARLASEAMGVIRSEKIARGIDLDREGDPGRTGLIGHPVTPVTSNTGFLTAKRTSINPNFAAVMVEWLERAGVSRSDVVAVGVSGSFPALCTSTFAALQTLGVEPVVVASASASEWGANDPSFMWLDMEKALYDRKVFTFRSLAASRGAIDDYGFGMSQQGRDLIDQAIRRSGVRFLDAHNLGEGIDLRMKLFEEQAHGRPIKAYVNVGGGTASVGTHVGKKQFKSGLNLGPPARHGLLDSVMLRFANRGIPVIHLTGIEALAKRYGFPVDPQSMPAVGDGKIYARQEYNRWIAVVGLLLVLGAMLGFIRLDISGRLLPLASRRKDRAKTPEPMV